MNFWILNLILNFQISYKLYINIMLSQELTLKVLTPQQPAPDWSILYYKVSLKSKATYLKLFYFTLLIIINILLNQSIINFQLSTLYYQLSTINFQLSTINYQLSTIYFHLCIVSLSVEFFSNPHGTTHSPTHKQTH